MGRIDTGASGHHALKRARIHLDMLEQDPARPLDLMIVGSASAPVMILRPDQALRSAHSDVAIAHGELRALFIEALRRCIAELEADGAEGGPAHGAHERQFGDQTEA